LDIVHTERSGLDVERVLAGLEQQRVHAASDEPGRLHAVAGAHVVERHVPRDGDRPRRGSHGPDHERVAHRLAGQAGPRPRAPGPPPPPPGARRAAAREISHARSARPYSASTYGAQPKVLVEMQSGPPAREARCPPRTT